MTPRTNWPAAHCNECQRRRIKVPDNLAVVGFGNSEFGRVCQPPLTTMTIPHRDIGIQAGPGAAGTAERAAWQRARLLPATLCPPRQLLNRTVKSRSMTGFLTRLAPQWLSSGLP